ncbi:MAG: response regulator [Acidobacteria bacterium]|nr:response regulator [Acidobacteriota bacterium]
MHSRATILCIDDDKLGLYVRKLVLESAGYAVITASSGRDGVRLFRAHTVDVVILDYYMPGMHGGTVAIELKRIRPKIPIIMLSAYLLLPDEVFESIDLCIQKGQPPEMLLTKIRNLV